MDQDAPAQPRGSTPELPTISHGSPPIRRMGTAREDLQTPQLEDPLILQLEDPLILRLEDPPAPTLISIPTVAITRTTVTMNRSPASAPRHANALMIPLML